MFGEQTKHLLLLAVLSLSLCLTSSAHVQPHRRVLSNASTKQQRQRQGVGSLHGAQLSRHAAELGHKPQRFRRMLTQAAEAAVPDALQVGAATQTNLHATVKIRSHMPTPQP
jgi:hypothetical protein